MWDNAPDHGRLPH